MKNKKKKHDKTKVKTPENFIRDDVPIGPAMDLKNHKSKKKPKKSIREDFHEHYY